MEDIDVQLRGSEPDKRMQTKKVCRECGEPIKGGEDALYCTECAAMRRPLSVMQVRICRDCGVSFEGGPRAIRCPSCREVARRQYKRKPTIRVCRVCGKSFKGGEDTLYCPECAAMRKSQNVLQVRTCKDCGVSFEGGPRAIRCPSCREDARRKYKKKPTKRPIGSIDVCKWCGNEYIVNSGRQKYCSERCCHAAVLVWQREHKKGYNQRPEQVLAKKERRKERRKKCKYCGREFWSDTSKRYCSDYCKKENAKLVQAFADVERGQKRNIQRYIDARDIYRKKISENL